MPIACSACNIAIFTESVRFRCLECADLELCEICMLLEKDPKNHSSAHSMMLLGKSEHLGIMCGICSAVNFTGTRWRCLQCKGFDACNTCHSKHLYHFCQCIIISPSASSAAPSFSSSTSSRSRSSSSSYSSPPSYSSSRPRSSTYTSTPPYSPYVSPIPSSFSPPAPYTSPSPTSFSLSLSLSPSLSLSVSGPSSVSLSTSPSSISISVPSSTLPNNPIEAFAQLLLTPPSPSPSPLPSLPLSRTSSLHPPLYKKHYCGRKILKCKCCDGKCGPTTGCSCIWCQELDIQNYSFKLNRAGHRSVKGETGKHYCGKSKLKCTCCDSICGPLSGCNCEDCAKLDHDEYTLYHAQLQAFGTVQEFFLRWWQKPGIGSPKIGKVVNLAPWDSAKVRAETTNSRLLFHGTTIECTKLDCHKCSACKIRKEGFKISCAGSNTSFLRFGKGIYFAPNSCKAHAYTGDGPNHAMVIAKVSLGNSYVQQTDYKSLQGPPAGYDSVYGMPGKTLNWPEYVVYHESSAIPVAVVIYTV